MILRLSCWGFLLRAMGSYGGVLSREGMASDVGAEIALWGQVGNQLERKG